MDRKKVVVFGGGSGTSALLSGLKLFPLDITAVITVSDSGSSTGRLRNEFHMPAIGDIRKVISNLSTLPDELSSAMEHRISTYSDLNGHPVGNLILTSLYQQTGSLRKSIELMCNLLRVEHTVLPLSEDNLNLIAETSEGEYIVGEDEIGNSKKHYEKIFYDHKPKICPEVFEKVKDADLIILSMGSLYTSLLPHLICEDVANAINSSKAKVLYVCNAMTQAGETNDFKVSDHLNVIESYLGTNSIDTVIVSNNALSDETLKIYSNEERKYQVIVDYENLKNKNYKIIESDLLTILDGKIRHKTLKLSSIIFSYLQENE